MLLSRLSRKRIVVVSALVVAILICSWGVVFASADKMLELNPAPDSLVTDDQPPISANWLNIPGIHVKSLSVFVDGREQTVTPPPNGTSINVRPDSPLAQGRHSIIAKVTYGLGIPRQVEAKWSFTVDTEPPPLGLADGGSFYVSAGSDAVVKAKSEPGAKIEIVLNDKPAGSRTVDENGEFEIALSGLVYKNKLRLMAGDKAGNVRSVVLPVMKDETTPVVKYFKPGDGEVVREVSPLIDVGFEEEDSGLKSVKLTIDGTEAVVKGDDGSKRISYVGELLGDGEHKVKVQAVDYADRELTKEWKFQVDSRRIVVNRSERKLYLYKNSALQRVYGVAVGQPGFPTPVGRWRIMNKQVNPSWHNPGSHWAATMPKVIPPGWSNPLGVRAMALNARAILIHGTSNYGSIGTAASHGCVRMRNSDIVEFFPLVDIGVPVDIIN